MNSNDNKQSKQFTELSDEELKNVTGGAGQDCKDLSPQELETCKDGKRGNIMGGDVQLDEDVSFRSHGQV